MKKLINMFIWMLVAVGIAGIFVAQVWKADKYVTLARNYAASKIQVEKLKSDIARIQLDNKRLKDYKRLEKLVRVKYGLVTADPPEFIYPRSHGGGTPRMAQR